MAKRSRSALLERKAGVGDRFTWLVLRACRIECRLVDVVCRSNPNGTKVPELELLADDDPEILELAKHQYEEEQARWNQVDEKARTLLTVAGLLVPVTAGIAPFASSALLSAIGLGLLVLTTFVILQIFGVYTVSFPGVDSELLSASGQNRFRALVAKYLASSSRNNCVNNFRVDLYRAAHRLFVAALLFVAVNGVLSVGDNAELLRSKAEKGVQVLLRFF